MNPDAIKDGGAAYPVAMSEQTSSNQFSEPFQTGMSLRDHYAGLALQGICTDPEGWGYSSDEIAKKSFERADAMIRARKA